jgi:hypothetical protein
LIFTKGTSPRNRCGKWSTPALVSSAPVPGAGWPQRAIAAVVSVSADKDAHGVLEPLAGVVEPNRRNQYGIAARHARRATRYDGERDIRPSQGDHSSILGSRDQRRAYPALTLGPRGQPCGYHGLGNDGGRRSSPVWYSAGLSGCNRSAQPRAPLFLHHPRSRPDRTPCEPARWIGLSIFDRHDAASLVTD